MYNSGGILVGIGATGTTVLASTGSTLTWVAYSVAAASLVIGGLLALRSRLLKRHADAAVDVEPTAA
jgi:hypothetical protein